MLVVKALKMHRKKVDKFIFTIHLLVVVISIIASSNTTSADLNNSPPTPGKLDLRVQSET